MELPGIGKHCSKQYCNKLDFLPIKCDVCSETFCAEHYSYMRHDCRNAYQRNNQVPVCPLCNIPIPVGKGQVPDLVVGAHIDTDCQSDPAKSKRRVFTNRCSMKGCKIKEVIPVVCTECAANYCLKHRHPHDHSCQGKAASSRNKALNAAMERQSTKPRQEIADTCRVQGNMSEDEALARALALSMQDASILTQEDRDLALARQLQATEYQQNQPIAAGGPGGQPRDRCNVL